MTRSPPFRQLNIPAAATWPAGIYSKTEINTPPIRIAISALLKIILFSSSVLLPRLKLSNNRNCKMKIIRVLHFLSAAAAIHVLSALFNPLLIGMCRSTALKLYIHYRLHCTIPPSPPTSAHVTLQVSYLEDTNDDRNLNRFSSRCHGLVQHATITTRLVAIGPCPHDKCSRHCGSLRAKGFKHLQFQSPFNCNSSATETVSRAREPPLFEI